MARSTTLRGLERGLQVFKILQRAQGLTLNEIYKATSLSKPSLLRILATLERSGMIHRRLDDGQYRASAKLAMIVRKPNRFDYLAEAAAPVLDRLCRKIVWPSDLTVPAGDHMEIRETSRALSPFALNSARIGNKINWLLTAHGRAYLAFCTLQERQRILNLLRNSKNPQDRLTFRPKRIETILAETRARGYGRRDPAFSGGFYDQPAEDGLAGIAVPLLQGDRVHGCINILWVRRALSVEEMVTQHLSDLKAAAAEIVSSLS